MNLTWITWGIGALLALIAVLCVLLALLQPRIAQLIRDAPMTNLSLLTTLALLVVVVAAWTVKCVLFGGAQPQGYGETVTLLGLFGGVSGGMHISKRFGSADPAPPSPGTDVEDVKPTPALPADLTSALRGAVPKPPVASTASLNRGEADAP